MILPLEDLDHIKELRADGFSWSEIGEHYQKSGEAMRSQYRRALAEQQRANVPEGAELTHVRISEYDKETGKGIRQSFKLPPGYDRYAKLREALVQDIRDSVCVVPPVPPASSYQGEHLLEMATVDHHFGSLAWGQETGTDYDLNIASDLFEEANFDLIAKAGNFDIERVLVVMGNDLLHFDNLAATTTAGTPQDADTRYIKVFRQARKMIEWQVRLLRQMAPVDIVVVPGNHDRLAAFHLGEIIATQFAEDKYVSVDNSPKYRKYYEYGCVGLGFTHGDEQKLTELPRLMMDEAPELVGRTTHKEWHVGHWHHRKQVSWLPVQAVGTTTVRVLPSLCGIDAWHAQKGYRAPRGSEAYLWHKSRGYCGHFSFTPEQAGYNDV